jgi:hypothetical protein
MKPKSGGRKKSRVAKRPTSKKPSRALPPPLFAAEPTAEQLLAQVAIEGAAIGGRAERERLYLRLDKMIERMYELAEKHSAKSQEYLNHDATYHLCRTKMQLHIDFAELLTDERDLLTET